MLISLICFAAFLTAIVFIANNLYFKQAAKKEKSQSSKIKNEDKQSEKKKLESIEDYEHLDSFFTELRRDVTNHDKNEPLIAMVSKRFDKVLMNTVVDGKKFRGLAVVKCFKSFAADTEITEDSLRKCYAYGWHLEMIQASLLIYDDIMDNSLTRRGQPCWYLKNNNGVKAIDDGSFLRLFTFLPLKKYCSQHPCYVQLISLSKEILNLTTLGQILDCYTTPDGRRPNYTLLNEVRYDAIVKYKTSYYTFVMPVRGAMYLANITDETTHNDVEVVLLRIGFLFQAQDDYIDVFGDPKVSGKIGTDIEDGKCTWIAVQAYKLMDSNMKKLFEENFGRKERVSFIKSTFEDLEIKQLFEKFEESEYNEIQSMISKIEEKHHLNMKSVRKVLDMVYKRKK